MNVSEHYVVSVWFGAAIWLVQLQRMQPGLDSILSSLSLLRAVVIAGPLVLTVQTCHLDIWYCSLIMRVQSACLSW